MTNVHLQATKEEVLLDAEDRHRMTRLYEEVFTRLEEMAMITTRALGMSPGFGSEVLFSPVISGEKDDVKAVEVVRGSQGSVCYDYSLGSCFTYQPDGEQPDGEQAA